jgi:hypothetical protein
VAGPGSGGAEIEAASLYLRELLARDNMPETCRSYAYDLLGWFRFLDAGGLAWDQASLDTVRNYVLHLKTADNPYRHRGLGRPVPGSVNVRTGKPYLRTGHAPRPINHRLSVRPP